MTTHTVSALDLRAKLGDYLNRVEYAEETIVVVRKGRPCARLVPFDQVINDPTAAMTPATVATKSPRKSPGKP